MRYFIFIFVIHFFLPPILAEERKNAPDNLDFYSQSTGYCTYFRKQELPLVNIEKSNANMSAYNERLQEEACKVKLIAEKIRSAKSPAICSSVEPTLKSSCFSQIIDKIHKVQPLSRNGIMLFTNNQFTFASLERKEEKAKGIDSSRSAHATQKLLLHSIQAQKLLKSRASVKDWIGKDAPEIQRNEDILALNQCTLYKQYYTMYTRSMNLDQKALASLEKEKKEFDSMEACK